MNKKIKLIFITLSTTTFFLVIFATTWISIKEIKNYFLKDIRESFQVVAQEKANEYLNLSRPVSIKFMGDYQGYFSSLASEKTFSEVKIIDPNGTIVHSDSSKEINSLVKGTGIEHAINGEVFLESVDYNKRIASVIAPIKSSDNQTRGIIRANVKTEDINARIYSFLAKLIPLTGGLTLVFFVIIYWIFSESTKSIESEDSSIIEKSKALEEEKQLDQAIMSSVAESLIVINKEKQIILFNPDAEKITGFKESEVQYRLYKKFIIFVDKDGKEIKDNPIERALRSGEKIEVKIKDGYFIKKVNKDLTPVSVSVAPIRSKSEVINGVVATIQDITTEKELDKVKDEFVYVVAHELGNPIFAMDGYLSILDDKIKKCDSQTKSILTSTRALNQQLSSLVNDLLEVVRNEQGHLSCEISQIDLKAIIEEASKSASFKSKGKNIKITLKEIKIPKVYANEQKIREVLVNLIDNAIKYTPAGGKIEISSIKSGNTVTTSIKDNGYGMSPEEREQLFTKFYRIKNDDTKDISGTGLGLFICKQIVEKCGGTISAESEKGKGSTLSFSLKTSKK